MSSSDRVTVYDEDEILAVAGETPLPEDGTDTVSEEIVPITTPSPAHGELPETPMSPDVLANIMLARAARRARKRRAPPANIEIFVDADADDRGPPPKKSARKDGRFPLGPRKDFGNACPRTPVSPPSPPLIPSVEDWNRFAHLFTPPATPSPQHRLARLPTPPPKEPVCLILYNFLEISNWKATTAEIKAAYKRAAVRYHPDKVNEETKVHAHDNMLLINASRDVLVDKAARERYHKDGKLPVVFAHVFPELNPNTV